MHLRYEFLMLGLQPVIEKLKKHGNSTLNKHIEFFELVRTSDEKEFAKKFDTVSMEDYYYIINTSNFLAGYLVKQQGNSHHFITRACQTHFCSMNLRSLFPSSNHYMFVSPEQKKNSLPPKHCLVDLRQKLRPY